MGGTSRAFLLGGVWFLFSILLLGTLAEAVWNDRGGTVTAHLAIFYGVGGVIGLVIHALRARDLAPPSVSWTCRSCGAANAAGGAGCVACGEPRP